MRATTTMRDRQDAPHPLDPRAAPFEVRLPAEVVVTFAVDIGCLARPDQIAAVLRVESMELQLQGQTVDLRDVEAALRAHRSQA